MSGSGSDPQFGPEIVNWTSPIRPNLPEIRGRYVTLERLDAARHGSELFVANSLDDRIWDYLPYGPFQSEPAYLDWLTQMQASPDPFFYTIRNGSSDRCEGVASYLRITPESGSIEAGHLNFSPALQKSPAATEAIYLMMRWAFEAGYRRFEWKCDALNRPSRRAAQRLGLSYEGVFRQATIYKGRNRDTAWFAAIDTDWPALRAAFDAWLAPENFDDDGSQKTRLSALTAPILVSRDDDPYTS